MKLARTLTALALCASSAFGHGVGPQTLGAAGTPWSANGLVVPTTFGLLVTADRCTWQWICTAHVGTTEREQPTWHVSAAGTIFAGALSGLFVSRDRGCTFERHPFFDATGAAQVISDGATVWVVTGKFGATNGLARSTDDGRSFQWTTARASEAFFTAVVAAPSNPQRLYASSWYFDPPRATLWVSDDGAMTFQAVAVTVPSPGSVFTVHAVDRANPERLYASASDTSTVPVRSLLLLSGDRGQTFERVLEGDRVPSGVVQADGRWLVAMGDRLFESADGRAFSALASPTQRACVARVGAEIFACGRPGVDPFVLGQLSGSELTPLLNWAQVSGPVTCDASTPGAAACATTWPVEKAELGLPPDHEAACSAPPPPPATKAACCQASVGEGVLCALFFLRRRRRVESGTLQ